MIETTLDTTLGSAFIGNILASCLLGLTTLQTYIYYGRSRNDPGILRALVGLLWLLDVAHLILLTHAVYEYAVTNFGRFEALARPPDTVRALILLTASIGANDFIVRGCHILFEDLDTNHNVAICGTLIFGGLVALGSTIGEYKYLQGHFGSIDTDRGFSGQRASPMGPSPLFCHLPWHCETWIEVDENTAVQWLMYVGLGTASLADILVAITSLDTAVRTLQVYIVNTGATTSLCSLVTLLLYATGPTTMVYLIGFCILPKLFLNAMLAMLNARKSIRDQMIRDVVKGQPAPPIAFKRSGGETEEMELSTSSSVMLKSSLMTDP
ncbi:hypothetical protein C8Q76DRAFT_851916 [Earliella scabrosa]|nr:hypothetical protein C8Q76DRAFT_851916 [Earliella scabrosa]